MIAQNALIKKHVGSVLLGHTAACVADVLSVN